MVTTTNRPTNRQGEYRAICLWKVGRQSFAKKYVAATFLLLDSGPSHRLARGNKDTPTSCQINIKGNLQLPKWCFSVKMAFLVPHFKSLATHWLSTFFGKSIGTWFCWKTQSHWSAQVCAILASSSLQTSFCMFDAPGFHENHLFDWEQDDNDNVNSKSDQSTN